jgi:phenylpropionate dioxygenase-like ring-hydroxylating dioxygenase large terminal subunit
MNLMAHSPARETGDGFDPRAHGLKSGHVESIGGLIFVCVAREPPSIAAPKMKIEPYLMPFDLRNAKVAFESRIVEHGNWKLVLENNRECYHCAASHPELTRTFPESTLHSGAGGDAERADLEQLVEACEAKGLPGRYWISDDNQCRVNAHAAPKWLVPKGAVEGVDYDLKVLAGIRAWPLRTATGARRDPVHRLVLHDDEQAP